MGDSMKFYVLIETCCMHFEGIYSEEGFKNNKWEYEDEHEGRMWFAYELKDGKIVSSGEFPATP